MADKALYNQVLANPAGCDADTIARLIRQYPYAQPLSVIQAQKQFEAGATDPFRKALLYTRNPAWLFEQVTLPPQHDDATTTTAGETVDYYYVGEQPDEAIDEQDEIALQLTQDDQAISADKTGGFEIDDPEAQAADEILQAGQAASDTGANQHPVSDNDDDTTAPVSVTEAPLLPDHPASVDYLTYEKLTTEETPEAPANESQEIVPLSQGTPHEKVSLYDDDHMPYSFLWWLNKTRMEHAQTYQPYAAKGHRAAAPSPDEKRILDQQIRENIFHLQSPEEKLSEPHKTNTVPFQIPQKIDPVIERFIREEPQIKPPQPEKIDLENKARQSAEDQLNLVTETLAKIYEDQGLYPKAIAIYKKLSLKYPEKSGYFAGLITTLENKLT